MKVAHVRERHAPPGTPYRLAAALDLDASEWLDLEVARRRLIVADPRRPQTARSSGGRSRRSTRISRGGLRVAALGELVDDFVPAEEDDEAVLDAADLAFGPPVLRPTSLRDFYAFERHVATIWARRGGEVPEAWYRLPVFYFSNVSEIRGPGRPGLGPAEQPRARLRARGLRARRHAGPRPRAPSRAEEAIGGFTILNDWSARDLQREETTVRLGPAKGKDFASVDRPVARDARTSWRRPGPTARTDPTSR